MGSRSSWLCATALALTVVAGCAAVPEQALPEKAPVNRGTKRRGGAAATPAATPDPAPVSTPARPSPGCAKTAPPGSGTRKVTVGADQREYTLHVPASVIPGQPAPLVLNMHGLGMNSGLQANLSGWNAVADANGVVLAHPQGVNNFWNFVPDENNVDVKFLRTVATTIQAERCIDLSRTYANGISLGGIISSALACRAADVFAAVGLVAGIDRPASCAGAPPRPAIVFWGTSDCTLPFTGGLGPCLAVKPPGLDYPPVEQAVTTWATHNGCGATPSVAPVTAGVQYRRYRGCRQDANVDFYVVQGGGHSWPGSELQQQLDAQNPNPARGITTNEIKATELIWAFFFRSQLPAA